MHFDPTKPLSAFIADMTERASAVSKGTEELTASIQRTAEFEENLLKMDAFVQALSVSVKGANNKIV